jgi:hypothetical protein
MAEKYSGDKPKDCAYCYFWGGKKKGCIQEQCYYLLPESPPVLKPGKHWIPCEGCPYGKYDPCIGYCIEKILKEGKDGSSE